MPTVHVVQAAARPLPDVVQHALSLVHGAFEGRVHGGPGHHVWAAALRSVTRAVWPHLGAGLLVVPAAVAAGVVVGLVVRRRRAQPRGASASR